MSEDLSGVGIERAATTLVGQHSDDTPAFSHFMLHTWQEERVAMYFEYLRQQSFYVKQIPNRHDDYLPLDKWDETPD